jgi:hypothetical protein
VEAVKDESDSEVLRRIIDSACGTDAAHWLIAQALVDAGWHGPNPEPMHNIRKRQVEEVLRRVNDLTDSYRDRIPLLRKGYSNGAPAWVRLDSATLVRLFDAVERLR